MKSYDYVILAQFKSMLGKLNDHYAKCPEIPFDCSMCPKREICRVVNSLIDYTSRLSVELKRIEND